jgi:SOS-response transcriptional repressor LexA
MRRCDVGAGHNGRRELTAKQAETLEFVRLYAERHGASPTYQEIADGFGITTTAAFQRVDALRRRGYVTTSRMHRRIVLAPAAGRAAP